MEKEKYIDYANKVRGVVEQVKKLNEILEDVYKTKETIISNGEAFTSDQCDELMRLEEEFNREVDKLSEV